MMEKLYAKRKAEKFNSTIRYDRPEFIISIAVFFLILFMCFSDYSPFKYNQPKTVFSNSIQTQNPKKSCSGRYIYMHDLPPRFNIELLENCSFLNKWYDVCPYVQNSGFGPEIVENARGIIFGQKGWFSTDQFFLEVIFHNRMKSYDCLTADSSLASAIYIPVYAGLDLGRHLWGHNTTVRDSLSNELVKWLVDKPEWRRMSGGDHFVVGGRIAWDFRRYRKEDTTWGGNLMSLPESENLTMLTIETAVWSNDIAIPYPTNFHPMTQNQITEWQSRMRRRKRKYLFAFVGGPRPNREDLVRGEIISLCLAMKKHCKLLNCSKGKCHNPVDLMEVFVDSVFCLQPPGDSFTRRSTFDSIIAGCIPVFFHPGSAYIQYIWHLPKDYSKYSVFIPENLVKKGSLSIEEALKKVSDEKIRAMREEVIRMIPKIIYVNPLMANAEREKVEDAFDIAVKRVIERVEIVRNNSSTNLRKGGSWKSKLSLMGQQKWNGYF